LLAIDFWEEQVAAQSFGIDRERRRHKPVKEGIGISYIDWDIAAAVNPDLARGGGTDDARHGAGARPVAQPLRLSHR